MEPGGGGCKEQDERKQPQVVPWEVGGGFWKCFLHGKGCPAVHRLPRTGVESHPQEI